MSWAKDTGDNEPVFWLSGMAGTGKSTIARTLCKKLEEAGLLGAIFFISRTEAEQRNPSNVVRTLVYHLAHTQPHLRPHICAALLANPLVVDEELESQLRRLIAEPYAQASQIDRPVVVVIDGFDECQKDKDTGREGGQLLPLLLKTFEDCQPWLNLLFVSRHEATIRDMLESIQPANFQLHQVDRSTVRADISRYILHSLRKISRQHKSRLPPGWPKQDDIDELVRRSDGLFVYASTIVNLLQCSRLVPHEVLEMILSSRSKSGLYTHLDELYVQVLNIAVDVKTPALHDLVLGRLRTLLGVLLVLQRPVSVEELALLLELDKHILRSDLESISAVIVIPEDDVVPMVKVLHSSFVEFLQDVGRCTETFFTDARASHDLLSVRTVKAMTSPRAREATYSAAFWKYHTERASLHTHKETFDAWLHAVRGHPEKHGNCKSTLVSLVCASDIHNKNGGGIQCLMEALPYQRKVVALESEEDDDLFKELSRIRALIEQKDQCGLSDEDINDYEDYMGDLTLDDSPRFPAKNKLADMLIECFMNTKEAVLLDEAIGVAALAKLRH
jgi:hypothetical protein